MKKLKYNEMKSIKGGSTSYVSALNTVLKAISTLFSLGQALGSAIARSKNGNQCNV